jgi:hypothetical protein
MEQKLTTMRPVARGVVVKFTDTPDGFDRRRADANFPRLLQTSSPLHASADGCNTRPAPAGSEHRRPRAFSFAAPVSPVCFEATILKFLQHEQHFSLVACFTQFVHDRLRCNKSWFAATKEQRASAAEKNRWSDALRRHGQRVMRTP